MAKTQGDSLDHWLSVGVLRYKIREQRLIPGTSKHFLTLTKTLTMTKKSVQIVMSGQFYTHAMFWINMSFKCLKNVSRKQDYYLIEIQMP